MLKWEEGTQISVQSQKAPFSRQEGDRSHISPEASGAQRPQEPRALRYRGTLPAERLRAPGTESARPPRQLLPSAPTEPNRPPADPTQPPPAPQNVPSVRVSAASAPGPARRAPSRGGAAPRAPPQRPLRRLRASAASAPLTPPPERPGLAGARRSSPGQLSAACPQPPVPSPSLGCSHKSVIGTDAAAPARPRRFPPQGLRAPLPGLPSAAPSGQRRGPGRRAARESDGGAEMEFGAGPGPRCGCAELLPTGRACEEPPSPAALGQRLPGAAPGTDRRLGRLPRVSEIPAVPRRKCHRTALLNPSWMFKILFPRLFYHVAISSNSNLNCSTCDLTRVTWKCQQSPIQVRQVAADCKRIDNPQRSKKSPRSKRAHSRESLGSVEGFLHQC